MATDPLQALSSSSMTRREFVARLSALGIALPGAAALGAMARPSLAATPVAASGGTLKYGFWQPISNLDPQVGGLQVEASINQGIQDRLIWKKPGDPTYYPGLATSRES